MKKVITAIVAFVVVALMAFGYMEAVKHREHTGDKKFAPKETIFEHLGDAYGWELPFNHSVRIPLPIIVLDQQNGIHCFMSSEVTDGGTCQGFYIAHEGDYAGKVVGTDANGKEYRPLDFSITKNAAGIFISAVLVVLIVFSIRNWYKKHNMKAPRKFTGALEMLVEFVYHDTIRPIMGKEAPKYGPYLLSCFFFILTMNLLGLIVIFPGGANLTGNLAVTMVLALATFLVTNLTGNREYWKEIFWPNVPVALKLPLMPVIEFFGIFTKPFALMIRLFANMMGGHMVVIVFFSLIFIFGGMFGAAVGAATSVFSLAFALFMLLLDTLVSFIQAYVFTILSTMFIFMAHPQHHGAEHEQITE